MTPALFQQYKTLGGTGTQRGGTAAQLSAAETLMRRAYANGYRIFRHGDCIGADVQLHAIALRVGFDVIIHPPSNSAKRAFCKGAVLVLPPKPYLVRNHDIVDESDDIIAMPGEKEEQLRSGTWSTIRYARKLHKQILLVLP